MASDFDAVLLPVLRIEFGLLLAERQHPVQGAEHDEERASDEDCSGHFFSSSMWVRETAREHACGLSWAVGPGPIKALAAKRVSCLAAPARWTACAGASVLDSGAGAKFNSKARTEGSIRGPDTTET